MANIASSKKDARRSAARAVANRAIRSSVKTKVTKFRRAVVEGAEDAAELAVRAVSGLDRAAAKGVLHRNNAARRKSRLMKRLNAIAPDAPAEEKPAAKKAARTKTQAKAKSPAKPSRAATSKRKS